MTYLEQLEIEKINKNIIENIITTISADEFINFYKAHNQKETLEHYKIKNTKILTKILKAFNYDFTFKKALNKNKKAVRTHESYLTGGQKSAETQKAQWKEKSQEDKDAWALKQSLAHLNSPTFKEKITKSNLAYRQSLTEAQRIEMDKMRSNSMKTWWNNLSEEEQAEITKNRFKSGATYHMKDSQPNLNFCKLLDDAEIKYEREYYLEGRFFDFKIDNILIEINPAFTHNTTFNPFGKPIEKGYHKDKSEIAKNAHFRCIHIFEWDNMEKVIKLLKRAKTSLYARVCEVKTVAKQEAIDFLELNHLQGYAKDEIRLGLYTNNKLVSIMTFGKPRYNKKYQYELIRYCSDCNIIGGAQKLFSHFINNFLPESLISYCDLSKFDGKLYETLGFKLLRAPSPSKHWYNKRTKEHYLDSLVRQQGFSRLIHHCDASEDTLLTNDNTELMISAGFVEIYDCGQAAYFWTKE